jgi:hypothetical protein
VPGVALGPQFAQRDLVELPFPATQQAVDALLSAYSDKIRQSGSPARLSVSTVDTVRRIAEVLADLLSRPGTYLNLQRWFAARRLYPCE